MHFGASPFSYCILLLTALSPEIIEMVTSSNTTDQVQWENYVLIEQWATWKKAKEYCYTNSSVLAMPPYKSAFMNRTQIAPNVEAWIGLNKEAASSIWRWATGEALNNTMNATQDNQNRSLCMSVNTAGDWKNKPCNTSLFFICSIDGQRKDNIIKEKQGSESAKSNISCHGSSGYTTSQKKKTSKSKVTSRASYAVAFCHTGWIPVTITLLNSIISFVK
ncbi:macrophage mannose receptor 1-like [Erpetoichthys calabaricus]|uniref:macrophage mannose receptor 1-like n=1 Tax=Erpetoichthys calabaricus TaxID=27687 RepID=UPI002234A3E5|nr:macrophage mannose receptor 1-like [Erpetoichthys calabaricus]